MFFYLGDDSWLVLLFGRCSLSDCSAVYDILILRFVDFYVAARWRIWVGDFECDYVEYSWSVSCVDWLPFWAGFCERNYDDSRKNFACDCSSARVIATITIRFYEVILLKAREQGTAGATVLRGMMGFG